MYTVRIVQVPLATHTSHLKANGASSEGDGGSLTPEGTWTGTYYLTGGPCRAGPLEILMRRGRKRPRLVPRYSYFVPTMYVHTYELRKYAQPGPAFRTTWPSRVHGLMPTNIGGTVYIPKMGAKSQASKQITLCTFRAHQSCWASRLALFCRRPCAENDRRPGLTSRITRPDLPSFLGPHPTRPSPLKKKKKGELSRLLSPPISSTEESLKSAATKRYRASPPALLIHDGILAATSACRAHASCQSRTRTIPAALQTTFRAAA